MASVFNFRCSGSSRLPQFQWPRTGPTRLPRFIEPVVAGRIASRWAGLGREKPGKYGQIVDFRLRSETVPSLPAAECHKCKPSGDLQIPLSTQFTHSATPMVDTF